MIVLIDWGTTNLRAWHVDGSGRVLARHESSKGLRSVRPGEFPNVLEGVLSDLRAPAEVPALMCGMVGSKTGWREVDYASTPANAEALAAQISPVSERPNTWIVGGVCSGKEAPFQEVVRGEEVQVLGILNGNSDVQICCLPGTHSKWITTANDQIVDIDTYMTGEMFELITQHSIISTQITSDAFDEPAFCRGLELSEEPGVLTHHIFQLRTWSLFDRICSDDISAMASGLLIGTEIGDMLRKRKPSLVYLCGSKKMNELYQLGCSHFGLRCVQVDQEKATVDGLLALWNLVGQNH